MSDTSPRVIVHLSDLHFGRADAQVARVLRETIWTLHPDVVAISGDLTQRARQSEFQQARGFLTGLPTPQLIVPGNHDVPLYNLVARLLNPLGLYTRFITGDLMPVIADDVMWMIGINTTRPMAWKSGRVDAATLRGVEQSLRQAPATAVKILVAHHPFDTGGRGPARALEWLTAAGIDVVLTGHLHTAYTGHTAQRYNVGGRSAVVVEATTATSTRLREGANGFNVLRVVPGSVRVQTYMWDGQSFAVADSEEFSSGQAGWMSGSTPSAPPGS